MTSCELQAALVKVATDAIAAMGIDAFKRTSMFMSNEKRRR